MRGNLRRVISTAAACLCGLVAALAVLPAIAGVNFWTAIGPDGANVVALAIDPRTPSTAFAGTTGSGILKTVDGGASWATANAGLPTANVSALAIDPSTPSTLFAGTDAGVFKSTDGGQSWDAANSGLIDAPHLSVSALAFDSGSPAVLYAATSGGLFKTIDGAANWTSITRVLGLSPRVIAIDPTSPSTLYVDGYDDLGYGILGYGILKSTDAGLSWAGVYTVGPGDYGGIPCCVTAIVVDPRSPSRLYALFGGLLRSLDGGASWPGINAPPAELLSLAIDPASSATLYAGTSSGAVFRTTDAGDHWTPVTGGPLATAPINVIAMTASAPATVYAGSGTGVFQSSDRGETWTHLTLGVRNIGVYPFAVDPTAPYTIYAGVGPGGFVTKTTDGGIHWSDSVVGLSGQSVNSLVIDPASPSTLYAGMGPAVGGSPVYKSTDAGAHWAPASNGLADVRYVDALAIAPSRSSTLYLGWDHLEGVAKSTDGGSSWNAVNNGLISQIVTALAVDPTSADIVYAATWGPTIVNEEIFKSTNGAAEWRQVPIAVPEEFIITSIVIDPATPSTIYAVPFVGDIFRSTNGGETWTAVRNLLPPGYSRARTLAIDPRSPSKIYASTRDGVFRSTDAAASWTPINTGLPNLDVWSISIDRSGSLLRAATPAGLFEYQISGEQPPGLPIGPGFTGAWYDPAQSGHGLFIEILPNNRLFAGWFTFNPAGNQQAWFVGAGTYSGNVATISAVNLPTGGRWIPNFDPRRVVNNPWGTLTFTFADCNHGKVDFNSKLGYGAGSMNLTRLTQPAGLSCP